METNLNPQERMMADESMVRNLTAQAEAIWPQDRERIRRYELADDIRILDAGCGTGEGASRLAELFPHSQVLGVDILDHHLAYARGRHSALASRLTFETEASTSWACPTPRSTWSCAVTCSTRSRIPSACSPS